VGACRATGYRPTLSPLLSLHIGKKSSHSELCAFKFEDIYQAPNGKPAIRLNFSKTDQFGTGKTLPISKELFDLLEKWRSLVSDEGYILRSISRHGHIGNNLHPSSVSTLLKALQKDLKVDYDGQPLSGHSFRVGAVLDLLEQGEPLERIMLRGGWQTDSTAMSYLRNWIA
jgi:integrase